LAERAIIDPIARRLVFTLAEEEGTVRIVARAIHIPDALGARAGETTKLTLSSLEQRIAILILSDVFARARRSNAQIVRFRHALHYVRDHQHLHRPSAAPR